MKVIITEHAKKRLKDSRQLGITDKDIINAASGIPGRITTATRIRGFFTATGRMFDIVVRDISAGRIIITIIGK